MTHTEVGDSVRLSRWRRRRKLVGLAGVVAAGIAVALVATVLLSSWSPVVHWTCDETEVAESGTFLLPLGLVNSPFGGNGSVLSVFPSRAVGYPPSWASTQSVGGTESNGSIWGAFLLVTANVSSLSTELVLGPGGDDRCSNQFSFAFHVVPTNQGGFGYGGELFTQPWMPEFGTGSPTDRDEPFTWNFSTTPGTTSSTFHNGFYESNAASVSTCGTSGRSVPVKSSGLTTWIPFSWNGQNYSEPAVLPLSETFLYSFPGDFGTWEVDNLSAPGGPGGGWAFNYLGPCT